MKQLGLVENAFWPTFVTSLVIELRRAKINEKEKYFLQMFFKNNEPNEPIHHRKVTVAGKKKLAIKNVDT